MLLQPSPPKSAGLPREQKLGLPGRSAKPPDLGAVFLPQQLLMDLQAAGVLQ